MDGRGWSVISDQQKGLVASLGDLMPYAEHRKCARHVFTNWKLKHISDAVRELFWEAVYSCNESDWKTKGGCFTDNGGRRDEYQKTVYRLHE
ncbi:hypothetical protein LINPERHAP1_LOCUS5921 [Linum perenne]